MTDEIQALVAARKKERRKRFLTRVREMKMVPPKKHYYNGRSKFKGITCHSLNLAKSM